MKKIVSIAGSDTSGGAGIQADLRTFAKYNLYGMSVLTVIVTMDPKNSWSHGVFPIDIEVIKKQMETVFDGVGVDTIKTGMLPTVEIIDLVAQALPRFYNKIPIVIDPVMVCKGDKPLFPEHAIAMKEQLMKFSTATTANLFEAGQLAGLGILATLKDAKKAAEAIVKAGSKNAIIKAAGALESSSSAADLLFDGNEFYLIEGERINTEYTHGLGCTYASHIASQLCLGVSVKEACESAKLKLTKGLKKSFALNKWVGTLDINESFSK